MENHKQIFGNKENPLFNWNADTIAGVFRKYGFTVNYEIHRTNEKRRITPQDIRRWFSTENSAYGKAIYDAVGQIELQKLIFLLENAAQSSIFTWQTENAFFTIEKKN